MNNHEKYAQILHFIKAHRNGDAAENMQARGLLYNMNYGVSIVDIREEAKKIGKNQILADLLWHEDMRETKLFALYLFDAEKCHFKKINDIVKAVTTIELAEHAAISILSDFTVTLDMIVAWCSHESFFVKLTGYNTLVSRLRHHKLAVSDFGTFFDMLDNEIAKAEVLPQKYITFALVEIARQSAESKALVGQFLEKHTAKHTNETTIFVSSVLEELKFL